MTGVAGPDAGQIRSALGLAARNMTTLDVHLGQLRTAVAPYPVVKDLRVSTQFPHGMRIQVIEQLPVGALVAGGQTVAASADGTLLHDVPTGSLPAMPLHVAPGRVAGHRPDRAERARAARRHAPPRLEPKISQVTTSPPHGLVVQLRSRPEHLLRDAGRLRGEVGGGGRGARRSGLGGRRLHRRERSGAAGRRRQRAGAVGGRARRRRLGSAGGYSRPAASRRPAIGRPRPRRGTASPSRPRPRTPGG